MKARKSGKSGGWDLFNAEANYAESIVRTGLGDYPAAVLALRRALEAKPDYAPAIFSLGTVEYQSGRRAEGRKLFQSLLSLPEDTTELCDIIDHAGDFLIQRKAYKDGLELFRDAAARFPNVAVFHQGVGCCAGHQRLYDEAVAASNRAIELEPSKQEFVTDLGWTFFLAGRLREAEEVLERAVSMDPANVCARNNLRLCKNKLSTLEKKNATTDGRARPARQRRRTTGVI
ncbi:MAG: tetratricopeptide repeat protein [Acidobacteria bacterium]|nr:tetratricopeptide repeat protein [Acidobacteriota bacterium]